MDGEVKVTINYDRIAAARMPPQSKAYGFNFYKFFNFSNFSHFSHFSKFSKFLKQ